MNFKAAAIAAVASAMGLAVQVASASPDLQAPELAEMVAAGTLPPLEDRLPFQPPVIEPLESAGAYGGTWRFGDARGADEGYLNFVAYEGLTRLTPEGGVEPNLVERHQRQR